MENVLCTTLIMILMTASFIAASPVKPPPVQKYDAKQMKTIEDYMNKTVNPCDDFFTYACGNWEKYHKKERYSETTGYIDHIINKKLVSLFKKPEAPENYTNSFYENAKIYFQSCKATKEVNLTKYLDLVKPAFNVDWPIRQPEGVPWPSENFDWFLTLAKLKRYDLKNTIIEQMVLPNSYGNSWIIDMDKPVFEETLVFRVPDLYGFLRKLKVSSKNALKIAKNVVAFEKDLIEMADFEGDAVEVPIKELEEALPDLAWRRYLATVLGHAVKDDFIICIRNAEYFEKLSTFMSNTDQETVCNYIMLKFVFSLLIDGTNSSDSIDCIMDLRSKMSAGLSYIYEDIFVKDFEKIKEKVLRLLEVLKNEFLKKIDENFLILDDDLMEEMRQKVSQMQIYIGKIPSDIDINYLNYYYHEVVLRPKNYAFNHLAMLKFRSHQEHLQIFYRPNKVLDHPLVADSETAKSSTPFFLVARNAIVVPSGFLQYPIFHKDLHDIFQMSLLGFILAHEVGHGFDSSGLKRRHDLQIADWDIANENMVFYANLRCMQQQRPTTSIDERLADIVGIRLAYDAVFSNDSKLDNRQPSFTTIPAKQLFFLNFVQFFCGNLEATFADHDNDNIRVHQTLLNFRPFQEAFHCNKDNVYYTEEECRVW